MSRLPRTTFLLAAFIFSIGAAKADELSVTGITRLVDNGGRVDWAAPGRPIAFDSRSPNGYYDIWTMEPDGSRKTCLTCNRPGFPTKNKGNPAWRPDGSYIAFQAQREDTKGGYTAPGKGVDNELWVMNAQGTQCWKLVSVSKWPASGVLHPHFSADGNRLFWAQLKSPSLLGLGEWELKVADFTASGGMPHVENVRAFQPGGFQHFYESHGFTPDGRRILYTVQPKNNFSADEALMDLGSGEITYLNPLQGTTWNEHGQISPDGRRIIWASNMNADRKSLNLWIMNIDGSQKRELVDFHDRSKPYYTSGAGPADGAWSPDGRHFAVYVISDAGNKETGGEIYRVDF